MPAIVKCPNGCKLQVPVRKLFDIFPCPQCNASLAIDPREVDAFQEDRKHLIQAALSSDQSQQASAGIVFLDGSAESFPSDIPQETEQEEALPEPPPVVDQGPSDEVFANQTEPFIKPVPPPLPPTPPEPDAASDSNSTLDLPPLVIPPAMAEPPTPPTVPADPATTPDSLPPAPSAPKPNGSESVQPATVVSSWFHDPDNPGVRHHAEDRWKAYSLGWALVVIGIFLVGPVIYTMLQWLDQDYHLPLGRWSLLLVFFSAIQFLYALFLFQLPDWSSTRFVSYLMLLMTLLSSFMLAVAFLSQEANNFFRFLQLSIVNKTTVSGWLLIMSIIFGLMSYLCGRTTQQWMDEEKRRKIGWSPDLRLP